MEKEQLQGLMTVVDQLVRNNNLTNKALQHATEMFKILEERIDKLEEIMILLKKHFT